MKNMDFLFCKDFHVIGEQDLHLQEQNREVKTKVCYKPPLIIVSYMELESCIAVSAYPSGTNTTNPDLEDWTDGGTVSQGDVFF